MESKGDGTTASKKTETKTKTKKALPPFDDYTAIEMEVIETFGLYDLIKASRVIVDYETAKATVDEENTNFAYLITQPASTDRDTQLIQCLQTKTEAQAIIDGIKEPLATSESAVRILTAIEQVLVKAVKDARASIESSKTALSEAETESTEEVTN